MKVLRYSFMLFFMLAGSLTPVHAKVMYVTERILLGVHTEPDEESPLLASINSGSAIEVLEENEGFSQVKLADGRIGWVSAGYLVNEEPSTAQLDKVVRQMELLKGKFNESEEKLKKKDRELQIRNDQLSNARTSIRELKNKIKKAGKGTQPIQVDTAMAEELAAANQEVEKLKTQLREKNKPEINTNAETAGDVNAQLVQTQQEVAKLNSRIEFAMANLSGKFNPNEDDIERLNPNIPGWIWALMVIVLIVGLIAGLVAMDYWVRQRHGGFRL